MHKKYEVMEFPLLCSLSMFFFVTYLLGSIHDIIFHTQISGVVFFLLFLRHLVYLTLLHCKDAKNLTGLKDAIR